MLKTQLTRLGLPRFIDQFAQYYFQTDFLHEERLPGGEDGPPVLMVMNHTAFFALEVYLLGSRLLSRHPDFDFRTLVWSGFTRGPAGAWFRQLGCDTVSVSRGRELLSDGKSVLIMPEGVGATDVRHRMNHFHTGYLHMAKEMDVQILPIGFSGVNESIPWLVFKNRFLIDKVMKPVDPKFDFVLLPKLPVPRPTKVVFSIGEPIQLAKGSLDTPAKVQRVNRNIKATVSRLMDEAELYRSQKINKSLINRNLHRLFAGKISDFTTPHE